MKSVVMGYSFRNILYSIIMNIDIGLNDDYRNRINPKLCKYCKCKYPLCMKNQKFQTNVKIKDYELDCIVSYCSIFDLFYIY